MGSPPPSLLARRSGSPARSGLDYGDGADRAAGPAQELERQADIQEALADHAFEIGQVLRVEDAPVAAGAMRGKGRLGLEGHRVAIVDARAFAADVDHATVSEPLRRVPIEAGEFVQPVRLALPGVVVLPIQEGVAVLNRKAPLGEPTFQVLDGDEGSRLGMRDIDA